MSRKADRADMRWAVCAFSSREEQRALCPEGVSYLRMQDLEAAYELIMGAPYYPPAASKVSRATA